MPVNRSRSIAVVTDENGNVVERDFYDARRMAPSVLRSKRSTGTFRSPTAKRSSRGKRRNADGSDDTTCSLTSQTTHGFTNQEEIDAMCLVNLNARVYDPLLGRFMSPDPTVEQPFNLQDLNRYSYVGNNPLSFTDPSGLCFLGCFWKHIPILGPLFDTLVAKPLWNMYLMLKKNPLKFGIYVLAEFVANEIVPGITDFLDEEFDIASISVGGVSGTVIVGGALNQAIPAAITTGIYGGKWDDVLLAAADGATTPIINAQFGPKFSDPDSAGTGQGLTTAQMNATHVDWQGIAEHSLAIGAKDALIATALDRNAGDAFFAGVAGTFSEDVYRSYVHQEPNVIGSGDGGIDKTHLGFVIGYGVNNWGKWWSSSDGPQAFYEEGSWFSQIMDRLPIMDPTSMLHDVWSVQYINGLCLGSDACPTLMLPAFFTSAMALSSKYIPAYGLPGKDCRKSEDHC